MAHGGKAGRGTITGINVTPMVDITLVLLIIFMVTATFVADASLKIHLPKAAASEASGAASLTVTLDLKGGLHFMKDAVGESELRTRLEQAARANPGVRVALAADRGLSYGQVVHILDLIKQAGISRVGLSSER
ncbi:MAG: biopolymer transporter ExbD [bacterium]